MKRYLFLVAMLFAVSAYAIDTKGLTPEQVANIEAAVAQAKQANTGTTLTLASEWGQQAATAAEGFAKALGIAAREIGVTVNEFISTPAGKLTAALIVWKVAGATLISMAYGVVVLVIGLWAAWLLARHIATDRYESVPYSRLWGLWSGERKVRVYRPFSKYSDGESFMTIIAVGMAAATMLIAGALIQP